MASVGEEYEPISDDELDEILADSQKKEDQQDEEKMTGITTIYFYRGILEMFIIYAYDQIFLMSIRLMEQLKKIQMYVDL